MGIEFLKDVGFLLGVAWASGFNLYLTVAGLGLAHRFQWLELPGDMEVLANPVIIILAVSIYVIEFVADKVPYVDTAWDSVHTVIRPVSGAAMAYMATAETGPIIQTAMALLCGMITMDAHLMKASTRAAVNASPEPVSNSVASVSEDAMVVGGLWLMIHHPIVIGVLVVLFVGLSFWLIPKLFRFIKKLFLMLIGRGESAKEPEKAPA
jgi:hypothetical protein